MTPGIQTRDAVDGRSELPGSDTVHLWQCDLDTSQGPEDPRLDLSPGEIARAARFVFQRDRDRYIAAKYWVRRVLASYLDCAFCALTFTVRPGGKPCLAVEGDGADLRFSLSRRGPIALLAVTAARDVGVDIERAFSASNWLPVAKFCLSPDELELILSLPQRQQAIAATETWTRKEAVAKAIGTGLTPEIFAMSVGPAAWGARQVEGAWTWSLSGVPHPAAVAVADDT